MIKFLTELFIKTIDGKKYDFTCEEKINDSLFLCYYKKLTSVELLDITVLLHKKREEFSALEVQIKEIESVIAINKKNKDNLIPDTFKFCEIRGIYKDFCDLDFKINELEGELARKKIDLSEIEEKIKELEAKRNKGNLVYKKFF